MSVREQPVKFWRRRVVVLGGAAFLVLAAGVGVLAWLAAPLLAGPRLTSLTVSGRLQHVDPAAVQRVVLPELGDGFFDTRVDDIGIAVEALPWVAEASVRREWPHTLHVDVVEEVPVARWNGDGLMDARGKVFARSGDPAYASLPALSGRDGAEQDVLAQYDTLAGMLTPRGLARCGSAVRIRQHGSRASVRWRCRRSPPSSRRWPTWTCVTPTVSRWAGRARPHRPSRGPDADGETT